MAKPRGSASQEAAVVETFNEQAPDYIDRYDPRTTAGHSFNIRRKRVFEMLPATSTGTVLDVGCGPGIAVDELLRRGFDYYGVDISERMIAECRARFARVDPARFTVGRIQTLAFPDNFFDAVLCIGVVEYLEDDGEAIREMARVMKPGGIAIISMPNRRSPFVRWNRLVYKPAGRVLNAIRGRRTPAEIVHREYVEKAYAELLAQNGLSPVEFVYYNFKLVPSPFDRVLPRWTVWSSRQLEVFHRGAARWLGTGILAKAQKR